MEFTTAMETIKTRILIISDTHGKDFKFPQATKLSADIAIHCGDLTDESKIVEYNTAIRLLLQIDAPLKLVVAGNHDFTLDTPAYERIAAESQVASDITKEDLDRVYGAPGHARALLSNAPGITVLDEGTHHFDLVNGARLTVFASPFTPSKSASMGFQYVPMPLSDIPSESASCITYNDGHAWSIQEDTHIAITHGPPRGILDRNHEKLRTGSEGLFASVASAKPKVHCFGHIHEDWGARLVTWRGSVDDKAVPSHFTHIDNGRSRTICSMASLTPSRFDSEEVANEKREELESHRRVGACTASIGGEDAQKDDGQQTLFINAAMEETFQLPWIVDIELPRGFYTS
ncbi:Metallo-dependent phosphatase-like protein [Plectosphaerella plurivora]|uniref:Metallo-dependent phosphatase-like protein n=1 Tax=Plectosphaerella plurivora TaxID=936078 RepID=A0A9P9AC79_9PEZI|nr:Metallo-dependent phosphatase-like protein [Plectosphaerella plurivora]